jgi:hypothetical protein
MNRWRARLAGLKNDNSVPLGGVQNVQNLQNSPSGLAFEHSEQFEHALGGRAGRPTAQSVGWSDAQEERAAIAEYDGGAPRAWAEGLARLDPSKSPADVPPRRWLRFINDCGRFLDDGWAARAVELGWGPLDLFGCDRERPFARVDHMGLLWLVNGGLVIELHRDRAILQTEGGVRQTYRRRPVELDRVVLAFEVTTPPPREPKATPVASPPPPPAAKTTFEPQKTLAPQGRPRAVRWTSPPPPPQPPARTIPIRAIDNCPPLTVCIYCHTAGDVKRLVNASLPGSKSETLHWHCAQAWFANLAATRLDDPELTPYSRTT